MSTFSWGTERRAERAARFQRTTLLDQVMRLSARLLEPLSSSFDQFDLNFFDQSNRSNDDDNGSKSIALSLIT